MRKPIIAVSIGDLAGVGLEIALKEHNKISKTLTPIYGISSLDLSNGAKLLGLKIPKDFEIYGDYESQKITPKTPTKLSGLNSFLSFKQALDLADKSLVNACVTLPICKDAWQMAGLSFKGHTHYLSHKYEQDAIMVLGVQDFFVALFTDHIALEDVFTKITKPQLTSFLVRLFDITRVQKIAVLALNPHAGENGLLGSQETIISQAINEANKKLKTQIFYGPLPSDSAFTPQNRKNFSLFVAMYHDQGLIPVKTLFFDEAINISLGLPIIRTSVDHGTAFDIAYEKKASTKSYINAHLQAAKLMKK